MYKYAYQLLEYFITNNVPEIKYISLYNGQFQNIMKEREIPFPGALIEFDPIITDYYLGRVQNYEITITIHIGSEIYTGFERGDSRQDNSLDHLTLLDDVFVALDNKCTTDLPWGYSKKWGSY